MSSFGFPTGLTLKALLENPNLQNPLLNYSDSEKKEDGKESPRIDTCSAFLGPHLWDKTYDFDDFKLEYMDLDEFLSENGLPVVEEENIQSQSNCRNVDSLTSNPRSSQPRTPPMKVQSPAPVAAHLVTTSPPALSPELPPSVGPSPPTSPVYTFPNSSLTPPNEEDDDDDDDDEIEGEDQDLCESDLALARHSGQDEFDPRKHKFSDDDLKPQPMIKKSKKIFVPDCAKDDRYWARRKKNNVAAKRSRDARRVKENQIAMRASYLERENTSIKEEMEKLRRENIQLKAALSKYEKQS